MSNSVNLFEFIGVAVIF